MIATLILLLLPILGTPQSGRLSCNTLVNYICTIIGEFYLKGIVHLNIIFSYMKVNKICNLEHPVY